MAKTIIDFEGKVPAAPDPRPQAVSGAIQTEGSTPPAGMPAGAAAPDPGKSTVGPGARRAAAPEPAQLAKVPLARLVAVNRDGTDGESHAIFDESIDLGRVEGQLRFTEDPYLSDRHCRFFVKNGSWVVQDLDAVNGVYFRIKESWELEHGDRMLLGKQVLRFEYLSEQERDLAPAVEHGVLVFGSPLRTPWCRLRQISVAGVTRDIYHLHRSKVTVGREDGDILFPDDEFMSRKHLLISMTGGKAKVQDLGSSNGTYLRIRSQHGLAPGDMIRVGDQLLRFELQ